jgi:hypothetical protein
MAAREQLRSSVNTHPGGFTMNERITAARVTLRAQAVSGLLRSGLYVTAQRRNGGTAIDLCDRDGCIRMLHAGTARSAYDYLGAMLETLDIIGRA